MVDQARFPGLTLAWDVLDDVPGKTAVLNAANEIAVAGFLAGRIRFDQIYAVNAATLAQVVFETPNSLEDLFALDAQSRHSAQKTLSDLTH